MRLLIGLGFLAFFSMPCAANEFKQSPMGLTIKENVPVYEFPDERSVKQFNLDFATLVSITRTFDSNNIETYATHLSATWHRVTLFNKDSARDGWILHGDLKTGCFYNAGAQSEASLFLAIISSREYPDKTDIPTCRRLLDIFLRRYPDQRVFLWDESGSWATTETDATVAGLTEYGRVYRNNGLFQKAIECYKRIIDHAGAETGDKAFAYFSLMHIYDKDLNDIENTARTAFVLIEHFPDELIEGFEWNTYADIEAVQCIRETLERTRAGDERVRAAAERIISLTRNPPVIIDATLMQCDVYRKSGEQNRIEKIITDLLKKYPRESRRYYRTDFGYTEKAFAYLLRVAIEDMHDLRYAHALCNSLETVMQSDEAVSGFIRWVRAFLDDIGTADRDAVITAYGHATDTHDYLYETDNWDEGPSEIRSRQILSFAPKEILIAADDLALHEMPLSESSSIAALRKGDTVQLLYQAPSTFAQSWVKVKVNNTATIGWIEMRSTVLR